MIRLLARFSVCMQLLRTLITSALCLALGVGVGSCLKNDEAGPTSKQEPVKRVTSASSAAQLLPKSPPFTSVTASMEWVRAQMKIGDTTAAERLFHKDAGLTDDQRLELAKALLISNNFRRMDPRVLARIVFGLPSGEESDRLLWRLISDWSLDDAEGALRFLEALPSDRLNSQGVLSNAYGLVYLPAERVLAFAAKLDDKGRAYLAQGVAMAGKVGSWRNTSAILDKLNVTPQKDASTAEHQLGSHLAEIAPQAIESQIAAETDPVKRDELLQGYARVTGIYDPLRGFELDAQIVNPEARLGATELHARLWLESHRAAALAWLQSDAAAQLMDREERSKMLRSYHLEAAP